ncbi:MAG TPA: N-acetylmuramoyl-L-alanine amidase, partial [Terriglobales bacterium]
MSATPNNIGAGWTVASAKTSRGSGEPGTGSQNALQALLAFACIHEQAEKRRHTILSASSLSPARLKEEQFALDEVLQLVAERALAITGADGIAIALADENAIVCRAASGKICPDVGIRLDPNAGFSGACLRRGETIRCDDSDADPRVNAETCRRLGTRSMVAVPLATRQRIIGLVEAFSSETYGFNDSDIRSLTLLSELILAAVRPEEEDRLAELARKVLSAGPAESAPRVVEKTALESATALLHLRVAEPPPILPEPASPSESRINEPAAVATPDVVESKTSVVPAESEPAKILVDEKFTPPLSAAQPARKIEPETEPLVAPTPRERRDAVIPITPAAEPILFGAREEVGSERSKLGILVTAASILLAIGLLGFLVWKGQHVGQAASASTTQAATEVRPPETPVSQESAPAVQEPVQPGTMPEVTSIQHSSTADSSTIVIDVQDQVQYEAHSLDNPPRIYFDLHDTKLSAALANQIVNIDDAFLKRVRIAQPVEDVTRVVLETKGQPNFSVSLDSNPYRLTIQIHKASPATAPNLQSVPEIKPSPAITLAPKKTSSNQPHAVNEPFSIALDAGHGGWDLGTVGKKGLLEKDLVLDIVQRLGKLVEQKLGVQVVYTRQDDSYLPLEKRAEIANLARADLFLSVHANYSDLPTARGVETYFSRSYSSVMARSASVPSLQQVNWSGVVDIRAKVKDSQRFASDIQNALYNGIATRNPGIRDRGVKEAQY